ncbi:MAG: MurR/RpiR family transcriptional regulator [Acidimicrobiia bacterium]|nr:MurR/RpiR family transcriptional regulator [Acidimicrobiia bacterium]
MSVTSTTDLIAAASDRLTPSERRIAEAVIEDPTVLAFGTVSDLASRCGTSRPTVVRFAHKLGFEGYTDLQRHVRDDLAIRITSPSARIRAETASERDRASLETSLTRTLSELTPERLAALAAPIEKAETVWILSGETSRAGAHVLRSGLSMLRPGVVLVDDHAIGRTLGGADSSDTAVVFDFHRYRRTTQLAAAALTERGITIVAITDGPLSPLASLTDLWCQVHVPAVGPFDTSLPAVAVAELLVAQVARDRADEATDRIDATESLWTATGTFVE